MDLKLKLSTAARRILFNKPILYPTIVYIINNIKYEDKIPYMAIDNYGKLYVNEDSVNKLSIDDIMFVLCHEALHFILMHIDRGNTKDHTLWNYAIDLATNSILYHDFKYKPNIGGVFPDKFNFPELLSAEEYYELLKQNSSLNSVKITLVLNNDSSCNNNNQDNNNCNNNSDGNQQDNKQNNNQDKSNNKITGSGSENNFDIHITINDNRGSKQGNKDNEIQQKIKELIQAGVNLENNIQKDNKDIGSGISNMLRKILDSFYKPKIKWSDILKTLIDTTFDDYRRSYFRPNRKISYFPSIIDDIKPTIKPYIAIDLSGSIADKELSIIISELESIFEYFKVNKVKFTLFTDGIAEQKEFDFEKSDIKIDKKWLLQNINFNYTGGTSIKETLEDFEKSDYNTCIIFTDCIIDDWIKIKDLNKAVFVISTTNKKSPYYKTIHI